MKNKKISITIATLKAPDTLYECVKSYYSQSIEPLEVIIVCNHHGVNKIKNFIKMHKKIRTLKLVKFDGNKNDARNIGFLKSKGDYVLYSDDDMVPRKDLIEKCLKKIEKYDALIIPEKGGEEKDFLSKIHKLEKKIVKNDSGALTPRIFKKSLFNKKRLPFDNKFGILDEWGFYSRLLSQEPKIGKSNSFFIVTDKLNVKERIIKNYKKGTYIKKLIDENSEEGIKRVNIIKRGKTFLITGGHYFKNDPLLYLSLLTMKLLDLLSFGTGYISSFVIKPDLNK